MSKAFAENMGALRRASGQSQREAAAGLRISQALLSHYENGAREPGLDFVARACDYYGVSADYLLGRARSPREAAGARRAALSLAAQLRELADKAELLAEEDRK